MSVEVVTLASNKVIGRAQKNNPSTSVTVIELLIRKFRSTIKGKGPPMKKAVDVILNHLWINTELASRREKDHVIKADIWCSAEIAFSDAMLYLQMEGFKDTDSFKRAAKFQEQARGRELAELKAIIMIKKSQPIE